LTGLIGAFIDILSLDILFSAIKKATDFSVSFLLTLNLCYLGNKLSYTFPLNNIAVFLPLRVIASVVYSGTLN